MFLKGINTVLHNWRIKNQLDATYNALACSPDTTPAEPHLTSNLQQTKICTISDSQH